MTHGCLLERIIKLNWSQILHLGILGGFLIFIKIFNLYGSGRNLL